MPPLRTTLRRSALALVAAAVALALGEVAVRAVRPWHRGLRTLLYVPRLAPDFEDARSTEELLERSTIGFSPFCNFSGFVLNSRGFLTPEYRVEKPAGTLRVVALGDSFTFRPAGVPFAQQWTTLLGPQLERALGQAVEVVNLGMSGAGPRFERRLWQLEGSRLAPDVALLALFVGNDFLDEECAFRAGLARTASPLDELLLRGSLLYRAGRNAWLARSGWLESAAERAAHLAAAVPAAADARGGYELASYPPLYDDGAPSLAERAWLDVEAWRMSLFLPEHRAGFGRALGSVAATVEGLARDVARSGARLVVVLVPDEAQVHPAVLRVVADHAQRTPDQYDRDLPQRALGERLRSSAIEVLDLLPPFRAAAPAARLYRPRDTHWNVAGNALAARCIAEHLARGP